MEFSRMPGSGAARTHVTIRLAVRSPTMNIKSSSLTPAALAAFMARGGKIKNQAPAPAVLCAPRAPRVSRVVEDDGMERMEREAEIFGAALAGGVGHEAAFEEVQYSRGYGRGKGWRSGR
jgi:hypothetical protein